METTFDRAELRLRLGRFRGDLVSKRWPARVLQMIVGVWIACSTLVWVHSGPQRFVAVACGLMIAFSALLAGIFPSLRALVGLAGVWTIIATLAIGADPVTVVNNVYSVVLIEGLCMLPLSEETLFRRYGEERV